MRKIGTFLRMALAAGVLAGCSDGPVSPGSIPTGTFDGAWDGAAWRGSAYAVLQGDSLTVVAHRPDPRYLYDEYIHARVRFTGPGTYAVAASEGRLSKVVGGDAGSFPPAEGTLVIYTHDAAARTISGTVTLRAGSVQPAWSAAGRFEASVHSSFEQVPPDRAR